LVREAIEAGIKVEAIPGPSAAIMALSLSGLPTDQFTFVGFLPDKDGKRRTKLAALKDYDHTIIFYISKWKLEKTLKDMLEVFGERKAILCRELTKAFEEVKRSTISELLAYVSGREIKGEITLVVSGMSDILVHGEFARLAEAPAKRVEP
jgi:16S rRNA (cytidine1402-2'-O)-methyltransferase